MDRIVADFSTGVRCVRLSAGTMRMFTVALVAASDLKASGAFGSGTAKVASPDVPCRCDMLPKKEIVPAKNGLLGSASVTSGGAPTNT